jgi:hypothetical protein
MGEMDFRINRSRLSAIGTYGTSHWYKKLEESRKKK